MKKKRLIALIVLVVMAIGMLPMSAFAQQEACDHVAGTPEITPATFDADGCITMRCKKCLNVIDEQVIARIETLEADTSSFVYDAKVHRPAIVVIDADGMAVSEDNYTVAYENKSSKAPGKYGVTVEFSGELYSGKKTLHYTIKPAKVTGLKYSVLSATSVKISWTKAVGAEKYEVYNATTKKRAALVTGTSATIKGLTAGKSYNIKVRAYDADTKKYGAYSSTLLINTFKTAIKNAAVTPSSITLSWSKVSGASGYYVYRRANTSASWKKIATVKGSSNVKYTDKVKGAYYYCVKAYKVSNGKTTTGITSAAVRLRVLKTPTAKAASTGKGIKISWKKISGATGYMIQRRSADKKGKWTGSWTNVATVGNVSSYISDNGHGKYYHYRVRAIYKNSGVTSYGAYSGATNGWISYYNPDIWFFTNYETYRSVNTVPIKIQNTGKYTLRFYSKGAKLHDKDYAVYNRDLYLGDRDNYYLKLNYVDVKPGESVWLMFCVDGNNTWYDKYTRVVCKFRYDGVDYWGEFSFNYGLNWTNEFGKTGHEDAYGRDVV